MFDSSDQSTDFEGYRQSRVHKPLSLGTTSAYKVMMDENESKVFQRRVGGRTDIKVLELAQGQQGEFKPYM